MTQSSFLKGKTTNTEGASEGNQAIEHAQTGGQG